MSETHPHAIFVYGTLKSGHGNNDLIVKHNGRFVAPAKTTGKFLLNGGFPFVWTVPDRLHKHYSDIMGHVIGEVYRVTDAGLEACDRLEGHPSFYCRTPIAVQLLQVPKEIHLTAGIYLSQSEIPFLNTLQEPRDGMLEWGRDDREDAANFQRESARRTRGRL